MKSLLVLLLVVHAGVFALAVEPAVPPEKPSVSSPDPFVKNADEAAVGKGDASPWHNCLFVAEVYALNKDAALSVLDSERGSTARYRRILGLAQEGKARLEIVSAVTTKSGQRALSEALDEVRHPTEFAPPAGKGALACPTVYETRNVGDMWEFEIVLSEDGAVCDLNIAPQFVRLLGFRDLVGMEGDSPIGQAFFTAQKVTTATSFPVGSTHFLGSMTPPGGHAVSKEGTAQEMWLTFVRVHRVVPTAKEMQPRAKPLDWTALDLEYRVFSLERAAARDLLTTVPALSAPWEGLQALLSEKKARFEHLVTLKCRGGQRAVTEETEEVRFASEYSPATRGWSTEKVVRTTSPGTGGEGEKAREPSPTKEESTITRTSSNGEITPGYVNEFETRSTGMSVEVEPVVGPDGLSIDLNQVVAATTHLGDLKTANITAKYPPQPLFEVRKVTTSQTLIAGGWQLVGTLNPPGADGVNGRTDTGRTWLLFVRANPNEP